MNVNILLDKLPEFVEVNGREIHINADFRAFIRFEKLISNKSLSGKEKVEQGLAIFFEEGELLSMDIEPAYRALLDFYQSGMNSNRKSPKKQRKNGNVEVKEKAIYDYEFDAPYIYGAFLEQYGIDLNDVEFLHWFKFKALFLNLSDKNKFVKIIGYRATDLGDIKNSEEKKRIAKLQMLYALPDERTEEEKVAVAGAAFGGF